MRKRLGLRRIAGLTTLVAVAAALVAVVPGAFGGGVTGAAFTTVNTTYDGGDFCKNGTGYVNCNIYAGKQYVWLNGGPNTAYVGDGDYFFAVLAPGGQHDPLDGGASNLSDTTLAPYTSVGLNSDGSTRPSGDLYTNRKFHVTGGVIDNVYGSTHTLDSNKINLMPYDDTTNNGGVYILAICSLKDGYDAVTPSNCKYDAFKVAPGETTTPDAAAPTVVKDAAGAYDTTYTWDSAKSVAAPTTVNVTSGDATFHYTITATHSAGTNSNIGVSGTIQVFNTNGDDIIVHVTDALSDSTAVCTVKDGATTVGANDDVTVPNPSKSLSYSCSINGTSVPSGLTNTVTVKWPEQLLLDGSHLAENSTGITYTTGTISFVQNQIDECTTLTDTFDGSATKLGVACVNNSPVFAKDAGNTLSNWLASYASGTRTFTFTYDRTVAAPSHGCVTKNNTATFLTNDNALGDPTTGDNSASVTVCRVPANTGALTMGFWQNKNGQAIITSYCGGSLGLHAFLTSFHPFSDDPATTCAGEASYVSGIIKAANCTSTTKTCNSMLRAQMLATALNVYFSDPAKGGNKINALAPIGGVVIDLQNICKMIDGSGGTATCSGVYEDVSSVFGGATSLTVLQMLQYQNIADPAADAGANWYGQDKAKQVLAKDAFDAINNKVAFSL